MWHPLLTEVHLTGNEYLPHCSVALQATGRLQTALYLLMCHWTLQVLQLAKPVKPACMCRKLPSGIRTQFWLLSLTNVTRSMYVNQFRSYLVVVSATSPHCSTHYCIGLRQVNGVRHGFINSSCASYGQHTFTSYSSWDNLYVLHQTQHLPLFRHRHGPH